ncbi:MAG: single-stranded DNA-binding protein [Turicibacter sp.]|nr:single-stranded DNA-binding protein [Turicibacter sp.]
MINRVVLVGRLTRDPELKYTANGIANLRFSVAVNRSFTSQNGERQADFINCVAWRGQAENMAKFLRKGSLIGVEGRIETGSYQAQDGTTRYTTDVVADSVQFLEPRSAQGDRAGGGFQDPGGFPGSGQQSGGFGGGGGYGGAPSFGGGQQQAPANDFGMPSMPAPSGNQGSGFSSTINISDDDLPF